MKKIMFNDKYGLTQAVLDGRKTMTRRIIKGGYENVADIPLLPNGSYFVGYNGNIMGNNAVELHPLYCEGEEVAVAQSYKDIDERSIVGYKDASCIQPGMISPIFAQQSAGWNNKMFVRADLMPFHIRITNIKVERLQDITEEDCMKEGVFKYENPPFHHEYDIYAPWPPYVKVYKYDYNNLQYRCNARSAFRSLIDRISGKGTWESNPWVFVYEFELVK